jgi:hypothetical protein
MHLNRRRLIFVAPLVPDWYFLWASYAADTPADATESPASHATLEAHRSCCAAFSLLLHLVLANSPLSNVSALLLVVFFFMLTDYLRITELEISSRAPCHVPHYRITINP